MFETIEEILKTLNIELGFQEYTGNADEYIVWDIPSDYDSVFVEDTSIAETFMITINYWHKSKKNIQKYKKIKELFVENGFFLNSKTTLPKAEEFYGKNFIFFKEEYK